jgi:hypothetical protein
MRAAGGDRAMRIHDVGLMLPLRACVGPGTALTQRTMLSVRHGTVKAGMQPARLVSRV